MKIFIVGPISLRPLFSIEAPLASAFQMTEWRPYDMIEQVPAKAEGMTHGQRLEVARSGHFVRLGQRPPAANNDHSTWQREVLTIQASILHSKQSAGAGHDNDEVDPGDFPKGIRLR